LISPIGIFKDRDNVLYADWHNSKVGINILLNGDSVLSVVYFLGFHRLFVDFTDQEYSNIGTIFYGDGDSVLSVDIFFR
jgi:hypothetical protein